MVEYFQTPAEHLRLGPSPVIWIGSSFKDLRASPRTVKREIGRALLYARLGGIRMRAARRGRHAMKSSEKNVRNNKGEIEYSIGSGNVFADLGVPNADELLSKAVLTHQISQISEQRRLTQAEAAETLGIDEPKVSALVRGKLSSVSMARLYRFLTALGRDIEIVVRPKARGCSEGVVRVVTQTSRVAASAESPHHGATARTTKGKTATKRIKGKSATG